MIVKRRKENARQGVGAVNEVEWRYFDCRVRTRTARLCSCYICMNPRAKYGNSVAALTFQEIRCLDGLKDGLIDHITD